MFLLRPSDESCVTERRLESFAVKINRDHQLLLQQVESVVREAEKRSANTAEASIG